MSEHRKAVEQNMELVRERDELKKEIGILAKSHQDYRKRATAAEASLADLQKRYEHNKQGCVTLQGYLDLYAKTDELVAKDRETFGHLREALMKAEERAEKLEASLAQHVAELDKLNAANQAYRGEVDSLKASLAQAQRYTDRICPRCQEKKLVVCQGFHGNSGDDSLWIRCDNSACEAQFHFVDMAQARREGMLEAAKILTERGNRERAGTVKATIFQDAAAIRRAAEEK